MGTEEAMKLILSTCPPEKAQGIANTLVMEKWAACVSVLPGVASTYWWQGAVTRDDESLLLIKTEARLIEGLTARLLEAHPYDVPEVLVLDADSPNQKYTRWVGEVVRDEAE